MKQSDFVDITNGSIAEEARAGDAPERPAPPTMRIRPATRWAPLQLGELWAYRELLYFFVWRDLKVRYKQTALGAAWAIVQPFVTMVVFSVFFGQLVGVPSGDVPYPIFSYSALVPWMYFSNALARASTSLVDQERVITKIYFPRLLIPMSAVVGGLVDLAIALGVLFGMMLYYGIVPTASVLWLPLFVLLAVATALGVGLWLSALSVRYRDVRYVIAFLVQFWLFATPVAYPSSLVPERWRVLYGLNPMVGVIEGFRWALLGQVESPGPLLAASIVSVLVVLASGLFYFQRIEQNMVDIV